MYLEELRDYKDTLCKLFLDSEEIISLLTIKPNTDKRKLLYNQIYPYAFVPGTNTEANVYLCFDVEVPRIVSNNNLMKDVSVSIYLISHGDYMKTEEGLRIDLLAEKVDKLLNANRKFGDGLKLISVRKFNYMEGYYGVEINYEATGFNNPNVPVNNPNTW